MVLTTPPFCTMNETRAVPMVYTQLVSLDPEVRTSKDRSISSCKTRARKCRILTLSFCLTRSLDYSVGITTTSETTSTAFVATHTFPHPLSRLHRRCKVGTYTGFLHRINRATTSNSGFVRKAVKQGRAMISHGYELRDICDRVRTFSAFDRRKGWWPKVRGRIIRRLKGRQNT